MESTSDGSATKSASDESTAEIASRGYDTCGAAALTPGVASDHHANDPDGAALSTYDFEFDEDLGT
jgi:hypothetical protein